MNTARRQRTRWFSRRPWRSLPIAEILARRHPSSPLHAPESCDGEITAHSYPASALPASNPFWGHSPGEQLVAEGKPRFLTGGILPAHTTHIWSLAQAGVVGDGGAVYCPQLRALITETARTINQRPEHHPALNFVRSPESMLAGVSVLLAGPFGQAHYHLLWDMLAKLALIPAALRPSINHYLVSAADNAVSRDWLQTANVPLDRVIWLSGGSHFLCEQLLFSSLPGDCTRPTPPVRTALNSLLHTPASRSSPLGRWLWISRRGQPLRDLLWEEQLLQVFPRFERVDLSDLSAVDQMRLFSDASVVAGPHGSGFANLAFVNGTGDVIEFLPAGASRNPLYARTALRAGWRHNWAHVDFARPSDLDSLVRSLKTTLPPS